MSTPTSPKVAWGAIAGVAALALGALVASIAGDPDALGFDLPPWALVVILSVFPVIAQALTAYGKRDPLRDAGQFHLLHIPDGTGEHRADRDDVARGGFTRPA